MSAPAPGAQYLAAQTSGAAKLLEQTRNSGRRKLPCLGPDLFAGNRYYASKQRVSCRTFGMRSSVETVSTISAI
jgi:hypothetical protein